MRKTQEIIKTENIEIKNSRNGDMQKLNKEIRMYRFNDMVLQNVQHQETNRLDSKYEEDVCIILALRLNTRDRIINTICVMKQFLGVQEQL